MSEVPIDRKELDQFAANILINLALINAAALAAVISSNTDNYSLAPYAIGLISAVVAQICWYLTATFEYIFGDALNNKNQKDIAWFGAAAILFGTASASTIIYGCLLLLKIPNSISLIIAVIVWSMPIVFLMWASIREIISGNNIK